VKNPPKIIEVEVCNCKKILGDNIGVRAFVSFLLLSRLLKKYLNKDGRPCLSREFISLSVQFAILLKPAYSQSRPCSKSFALAVPMGILLLEKVLPHLSTFRRLRQFNASSQREAATTTTGIARKIATIPKKKKPCKLPL